MGGSYIVYKEDGMGNLESDKKKSGPATEELMRQFAELESDPRDIMLERQMRMLRKAEKKEKDNDS